MDRATDQDESTTRKSNCCNAPVVAYGYSHRPKRYRCAICHVLCEQGSGKAAK